VEITRFKTKMSRCSKAETSPTLERVLNFSRFLLALFGHAEICVERRSEKLQRDPKS